MAAIGFGPDQIRTSVSMAKDSSHKVKMGKHCDHSSSVIFDWFFFILAGNEENHKSWMGSKLGSIQQKAYELAALERLEKFP